MRWATERARTPRPRPTCSWQIRNPATNEVIHDRHICMLCCSLSLSRHFLPLSPSAFTASIRVRSVCTPIIDFCRQSPLSLALRHLFPVKRQKAVNRGQTAWTELLLHVAFKATHYFFRSVNFCIRGLDNPSRYVSPS